MRATFWLIPLFLLAVPALGAAGTTIRLLARDPQGRPVPGVRLRVGGVLTPPTGADGATEVQIVTRPDGETVPVALGPAESSAEWLLLDSGAGPSDPGKPVPVTLLRREELRRLAAAARDDLGIELHALGLLLFASGRSAEAEPLIRRALATFEKSQGPDLALVGPALQALATILQATGRAAEAEPLMRRAVAVLEADQGPGSPLVSTYLHFHAKLLSDLERPAEAEPLLRRSLSIRVAHRRRTGEQLEDDPGVAENLLALLERKGLSRSEIEREFENLGAPVP